MLIRRIALTEQEAEWFRRGNPKSINPLLCLNEQADLLPYDERWEFPAERLRLGDLMIILEYCRHGSLERFLRKYRPYFKNGIDLGPDIKSRNGKQLHHTDAHPLPNIAFGGKRLQIMEMSIRKKEEFYEDEYHSMTFTRDDLVSWAYQISQGMEYLCSQKVWYF
ncbi:unnamed protein product [Darwinula stevensoni]|uniref:Serine-threonine/tyrosine-protein kinase catalytic domain-containing protein n=1 Tax=Darwinula stevensoni TaxID=69355 RepID=A0A7R9AC18_9CRUS|nr:unnamed protein product [Darwinula stevensoni]CAG0899903.1 unnamed protein product [Darwinula stevensoni]